MNRDVIIVGGGAVGLCVALALAKTGRAVTVVSREPIGVGASSGNAGMIVPSHFVPLAAPGVVAQGLRWMLNPASPLHIRLRPDPDLLRWLWTFHRHATETHVARAAPILRDLSLESAAAFGPLQDELGDVGFVPSGLLMLFHSAKARKDTLALADRAEAAGLDIERLDADGVRALEPNLRTPAEGAVLFRQDARIDPDALLRRLRDHLPTLGVDLRQGVIVEAVQTRGDRVIGVRTHDGLLEADAVVLATGAWTPTLARSVGLRVPVQPAKGYSITLPLPPAAPCIPMILTDEKATVTPMIGQLRFTGTLALAGFDASVQPQRAAVLDRLARTYCPDVTDAEIEAAGVWSGFRPASPDGLPIVGRSPRHRNLILATGHGMMGVTLAPVTGRLVTDLLGGDTSDLALDALRVDRF